MKIQNTVQTKEKALEVINTYVSNNKLTDGYFKNATCQCECGETQCLHWHNNDLTLAIGICDCCGNDNAFECDVLNKII